MKLLTFQAREFGWQAFSKTLADAADAADEAEVDERVSDAVVAFLHIEAVDEPDERRKRVFKHTLKHLKWLANKRSLTTVVLHSFTHLGGANADPVFAKAFMDELDERLTRTGYAVKQTPFGWFCAWQLDVYGDSLAKVWKEV